jgi:soluble lytic murein transglycosylase-like protein
MGSIAFAQAPPAANPTAAELMKAAMEKQRASIAAQQAAVRKQAETAGATLIPWSPPAAGGVAQANCEPIADEVVTPLIENAAKTNELQVKLVRAVIEQESGFRPCAVSSKGAQGLMQLMPETAGELNVKDAFDPKTNIAAGSKYLKQLLDKYKGDTKLALAAYNAGAATVDAINAVPDIPETRDYVDAILKKIK